MNEEILRIMRSHIIDSVFMNVSIQESAERMYAQLNNAGYLKVPDERIDKEQLDALAEAVDEG